jgi:hypothetical protein
MLSLPVAHFGENAARAATRINNIAIGVRDMDWPLDLARNDMLHII